MEEIKFESTVIPAVPGFNVVFDTVSRDKNGEVSIALTRRPVIAWRILTHNGGAIVRPICPNGEYFHDRILEYPDGKFAVRDVDGLLNESELFEVLYHANSEPEYPSTPQRDLQRHASALRAGERGPSGDC